MKHITVAQRMIRHIWNVVVASLGIPQNRTVMVQRSTMPCLVVYQEVNLCPMEEFLEYNPLNKL
jgi:hypothetical protein